MANTILERHLVEVWQEQRLPAAGLRSEDGEEVRIVYPGRPNDGQGADFGDAVIECGHRRSRGDVELHIRSSDWTAHGHHGDPAYNRVVLHVVLWADSPERTRRQDGRVVPVLAVHRYLDRSRRGRRPAPRAHCPGASRRHSPAILGRLLDEAGDERFRAKAARFTADMAQPDASQVLFQGIMEALGYSRNKAPFRELARRVPLAALEPVSHGPDAAERIEASLFGAAGLLPSQRAEYAGAAPEPGAHQLEELWHAAPAAAVMPAGSWQLARVRPNNSPLRRMAAMGQLLIRYRRLQEGLLGRLPCGLHRGAAREIETGLLVTTGGYWADHYDFGCACRPCPTLLGRDRAGEIVVNVLLPFAAALGEPAGAALFEEYPRLAANSLEQHMTAQLGIRPGVVTSARRQQGLIHVYTAGCTRGQCTECRLS